MERDSKRRSERTSARKVVRLRSTTKSIVLGITGSIAAYKSAELASLLVKQGHQVFVVMTQDAIEFISPLTLRTLSKNPVTTSFFDEKESWRPGHIELADRANRSEEHTSELQSPDHLVCRLLLEKKKKQ